MRYPEIPGANLVVRKREFAALGPHLDHPPPTSSLIDNNSLPRTHAPPHSSRVWSWPDLAGHADVVISELVIYSSGLQYR